MVDMNSIGSIQAVRAGLPVSAAAPRGPVDAAGPSFKDCLTDSLRRLADTSAAAKQPTAGADAGGASNASQVLAAGQQAEQTLWLAQRVGDRLVAAVDELKQIRV